MEIDSEDLGALEAATAAAAAVDAPVAAATIAADMLVPAADGARPTRTRSRGTVSDSTPLSQLAFFHPECPVTLEELHGMARIPAWLKQALAAVTRSGQGRATNLTRVKQCLIIAVAAAEQLHALSDAQLRDTCHIRYTMAELTAIPSPVPLGLGVHSPSVTALFRRFHFKAQSTSEMERVDAAVRICLRQQLHSAPAPCPALRLLRVLQRIASGPYNPPPCATAAADVHIATTGASPAHPPYRPPTSSLQHSSPNSFEALRGGEDDEEEELLAYFTDAAAGEHAATPLTKQLHSVQYAQVPGDGHCWWHCVSKALGQSRIQLQREMRASLLAVVDPLVLHALALTGNPQLPAADMELVKSSFLRSSDFERMKWGGTREMLLLSLARQGQLEFLTINNQQQPLQTVRYAAPLSLMNADAAAEAAPARAAVTPTMQITLHQCNFDGAPAGKLNHWNLFTYRMQDGTVLLNWPLLAEESAFARSHRQSLLVSACAPAVAKNALVAQEQANLEIARAMDRGGSSRPSSPTTKERLPKVAASTAQAAAAGAVAADMAVAASSIAHSASEAESASAADFTPAHIGRLPLHDVRYVPISGLHNVCLSNAVARHFGVFPHELQPVVNDTLQGIDDATTLARYGLSVEFDAEPSAVQAAKQRYLQSANSAAGAWGGTLEMCLLSHARSGSISFLVIDHVRKKTEYYGSLPQDNPGIELEVPLHHCHTEGDNHPNMRPNHWSTFEYRLADDSTITAWPRPHTEAPAHRNVRYRMLHQAAEIADMLARRQHLADMTASAEAADLLDRKLNGNAAAERRRANGGRRGRRGRGSGSRSRDAHARYSPSTSSTAAAAAATATAAAAAAAAAAATVTDSSAIAAAAAPSSASAAAAASPRPSVPPMRRTGASPLMSSPPRIPKLSAKRAFRNWGSPGAAAQTRLTFQPASVARPATAAPHSPRAIRLSRAALWKQRRVNTHREIHGRPHELYCRTASQLCEAYLRVAAAAEPERGRQAQVANFFMDYTGRALFRGHRIGAAKKCQQMETLGERVMREIDDTLSSPIPADQPVDTTAAAATATATADAAPPANASAHPTRPPMPHAQPAEQLHEPTPQEVEAAMLAAIRKASFILAQGGPHSIQRAAQSLSSAPMAPLNDATMLKLHELHPAAVEALSDLPDHAVGIAEIDPARLDSVLRRRVHNGSAPGLSGTTGSHLLALWDKASPNGKLGFQLLIRDICNGVFDGELKQRMLACVLVPLAKKDNGVRPVAIAEVLVRCAAHYMMSLIEDDMQEFFPRIQFGVKMPGGSEAAAQLTRAELAYAATKHTDIIALKVDFKNAFNAISRARVWATLRAHAKAAPILKAFHWQYSGTSPLLVYERGQLFDELESSNGVRQGCPFAGFAFSLTVQPLYEASLHDSPDCQGFSIQDDFTIVGPAEQVLRAFDYLKEHAHTDMGLELVAAKCQVYIPPTVAADRLPAIHAACEEKSLRYASEMESLGVMFGPAAAVTAHCEAAVDASEHFFACISHPAMPAQTAAILLRYCAIPKLGYLARTTLPEHLLEPARRFDGMAMRAQLAILQQTDDSLCALQPRASDPDSSIHDPGDGDPPPGSQPQVTTDRASAVTKEQLLQRIALPLALGGLGVRSVEIIRHAAYFASLQQILPYFARMHPELRAPAAFQQTQLYQELLHCQLELKRAGAGETFELTLNSAAAAMAEQQQQVNTLDRPSPTAILPSPPQQQPPAVVIECEATAAAPAATAAPAHTTKTPRRALQLQPSSGNSASAFIRPLLSSRFPSPSIALKQSIDESWQRAVRDASTHTMRATTAIKLQHDLTRSLEAATWMRLFNSCGRYQQATLTALTLNPATSTWLTTPPLSAEPGYRMRDEDYRLAIRHRLGQLPYDDVRDSLCSNGGCTRRNIHTPSLLADPDHAHACLSQEGVSIKRRHDVLKLVLAQLARECGYHTEIEPRFPSRVESRLDAATGQLIQHAFQPQIHADLLLIRDNTRQLIDVSVVRPTTLTMLRGSAAGGSHLQPLVAAADAEKLKHATYDAECAKHGWKLVPFVLESLGAKGSEAARLLQRMSANAIDKSPAAFLAHADRMLSCALQTGNAGVASQGTADMLLHAYRTGGGGSDCAPSHIGNGRGPGRNQLHRAAAAATAEFDAHGFGSIVHADYRSARCGVRQPRLQGVAA